MKVQLEPAFNCVPHVEFTKVKPVGVVRDKAVAATLPLLVSVTGVESAVCPACTLPNAARLVGVNPSTGCWPVPLTFEVSVPAPVASVSVPAREVGAVGWNLMLSRQLAPTASVEPQVVET